MITVATYNMRKAIGTDRRRDPLRVIEVLHELNADVVALQEADRRFGARLSALPLDVLADHTPYKPVPLDIRPGGIGWHGNALLVRKSADILDFAPIALPTLEPRGAVFADIRIHGQAIRIVGMHLDLSGLWRRRQVRAVLGAMATRRPHLPTVLMGDLNEWLPHGGCVREFMADHRVVPPARSFHSRRPIACLDRIVLSRDLDLISHGVHRSQRAAMASDHLPVWARVVPLR